jgi:dipeptidyl aminopeptidase/acylaminoacyl peptidase
MKRTSILLITIATVAGCSSGSPRAVRTTEVPPPSPVATSTSVTTSVSKAAAIGFVPATAAPVAAPNAEPLAIVQSGRDVLGVQPGRAPLWRVADAVVALDGSALLTATPEAGTSSAVTLVEVFDTRSAKMLGHWEIAGAVEASVVAPKGNFVALTSNLGTRTRLVVIDSATGLVTDRLLPGRIRPEAFSVKGAMDSVYLYALDDRPVVNPSYYRVQAIDVATGERFDTNSRDKSAPPEDMTGTSVRAIASEDGVLLATLYRNPGKRPAAFVHILNLKLGFTYCADLPSPFGTSLPGTDSIALTDNDKSLLVASGSSFATIDFAATRDYDSSPIAITVSPAPPASKDLLNPRGAARTAAGVVDVVDGSVRLAGKSTPVGDTAMLLAVV